MVHTDSKIVIVDEIRDFIIPLSPEEFKQLEENILREGCREPLIVWIRKPHELVLVDGHNRYKICKLHKIPFKLKKMTFPTLDEVKVWMVNNQLGRRNLNPDQLSYYRGLKYISIKKDKGGYDNVRQKGHVEETTSSIVASQFNVSESTIKRDARFAEGLNLIARTNPKLRSKILRGEAKVKKADIQILAMAEEPTKLVIKNEADLFNKAKLIRENALRQVEHKMERIKGAKIEAAQEILRDKDPMFLDSDERLKRIKANVVSAINRAIETRNAEAIKQLKKLIDKLADELLD